MEVQRDARLGLEVPQRETLDQKMVEAKVEELYRGAFEIMRKELLQNDERREKEEENARHLSRKPLFSAFGWSITEPRPDICHETTH